MTAAYITEEAQIELDFTWLYEVVGYFATRADMAAGAAAALAALDDMRAAEAEAEARAEAANERFWENRGGDIDFGEWEARMGLVSYEAARDAWAGV